LIAATALVHGLTVATRDIADFRSRGVNLLNLGKRDFAAAQKPEAKSRGQLQGWAI
jgi:hypothetical protein